jgi:hypothetical protein
MKRFSPVSSAGGIVAVKTGELVLYADVEKLMARMTAPISDEEWRSYGGDVAMLRYEEDRCTSVPIISVKAANALIAARAKP